MIVRPIDQINREKINAFIVHQWYSLQMVIQGEQIDLDTADGFYVCNDDNGDVIGLITYRLIDNKMEILSLDSLEERKGIGTALIQAAIEHALHIGIEYIMLITTNDNLSALRFYQKRGFDLVWIHRNTLDQARTIKPEIPLIGKDGIPIKYEIELRMEL